MPKALSQPSGQPNAEAHASPAIARAEHLPPKLTPEVVQDLVDKFQKNYPGELLGPDSMPSIRLLSMVYDITKSKHFKWIPWQLRLSARQCQEAVEARSHKAARTETQLLAMTPPKSAWKAKHSPPAGFIAFSKCFATHSPFAKQCICLTPKH